MGGTLAREAAAGRRVALVDLTRGECGSRGTPEQRAAEAAEAARILGVVHRESLGLPDSALERSGRAAGRGRGRLAPAASRVVVTQHWEQRHPDHAMASRLVYDACFMAGLRNYRPGPRGRLPSAQGRLRHEHDGGDRGRAQLRGGHHRRRST